MARGAMTTRPRVSVVLIFLDAEEFIREAIQSVADQTVANWELLLVDDGSTDGSTEMARRYSTEDPARIRLLQHPGGVNRGMSASRNLGLREARGEFVTFLDADDVYLPEKLERQSELLDAHPDAAMVYGPTLHWHSWTGRAEDAALDYTRKLGVTPGSLTGPPDLVRLYLTRMGWPPGTCGVMVRREAAERVGGFEERFTAIFEDQAFFYKLCLDFPVYVQGESLDRYRQHDGSACHEAEARGEWSPRPPNPADRDSSCGSARTCSNETCATLSCGAPCAHGCSRTAIRSSIEVSTSRAELAGRLRRVARMTATRRGRVSSSLLERQAGPDQGPPDPVHAARARGRRAGAGGRPPRFAARRTGARRRPRRKRGTRRARRPA